MLTRYKLFAAFVALLTVASGLGFARVPARAVTAGIGLEPTRLPEGFRSMVVDDTNRRVFVSSYWSDIVTVLDFTGRVVKELTGLDGANSMLIHDSTLYVVLEERGTVDAYDTKTFNRVRRYGDGILDHPRPLAMAGGKLWTSTGECDNWKTRLASIDLSTKAVEVHDVPGGLMWCIGFADAPHDTDRLLAYTPGLHSPSSYLFNVSDGTPKLLVERLQDSMNGPLVVLPGERKFAAPAMDPGGIGQFGMADLRRDDLTYPTGFGPRAVAVTPARGGLLAAGLYGSYMNDIEVYPLNRPGQLLFTHDFGEGPEPTLVRGGNSLAWSGDGNWLFAVSADGNTGETLFHRFLMPGTVFLSVDVSVSVLGQPVTFTADVAGPAGNQLTGTVTIADATGPLATADVVGGRASVTLNHLPLGTHDVTATYKGDDPAWTSESTAVRLTVQAPPSPPSGGDPAGSDPGSGNPNTGNPTAGNPTSGNPIPGNSTSGGSITGIPSSAASAGARGYWLLSRNGDVYAFGAARDFGNEPQPAADIEATATNQGYWILALNGRVAAKGDARHLGDARLAAGEQAVSLSATPSGRGYWVFTDQGRVFPFGDAPFRGDMSAVALNGSVLGSVATPSGQGYWMVAEDGGVFAFGDARFSGSMGGHRLNKPVMAMAAEPDGSGYWLIAADGGVFAFDAPFHGSTGHLRLNRPISGIVPGPSGYLMVAEDGGTFAFGAVPFHGSLGGTPPAHPIVAVALAR